MKQKLLLTFGLQFIAAALFCQIRFTEKTNLLTPVNHYNGVAIAVMDMNGDGLDDIVRLNNGSELNIQYQTAFGNPFTTLNLGELPTKDAVWGICTADFDNNGFGDILAGGRNDGIKIARASADGSSFTIVNMEEPETFVQGVNFADINNDGLLDAFVCHDDGIARMFGNNGDGTFTYQPDWINLATVPVSDNSGNYGSVWSDVDNDGDLDLYIAHCRQNVTDPTDPRRINQLFLNNGDGTYTQDVTNASGLRSGAQSWTADFGDIDNDGDFDCFITNHDVSCQLLLNDGAGHFTDITASAGLLNLIAGQAIQGLFRDLDNDGYVDIIVTGGADYILRNNGNRTFGSVENIFDNRNMHSMAVGDLNHDGFLDIYAGYANGYNMPSSVPDALWMNKGNDNHFIGFILSGTQSNRSAVGAKVRLYSALGIQTREVRSGESYGISNSLHITFGIGQLEVVDSVVINWPSGIRSVLYQPVRDQYITVGEGGCVIPAFSVELSGLPLLCTGQTVDMQAPAGFTYQWSNGDTLQTITANAPGEYRVTITSAEGCSAVSGSVSLIYDPVQIPEVTLSGSEVFCAGSPVTLTSTAGASYLWSNGATTQSIEVDASGTYTVATQGVCEVFTSLPITVEALPSTAPTVTPDTVGQDGTATLLATGTLVNWYESENSTASLLTGNTFVTPVITETTTYWASNTTIYDEPNQFVGMVNHQGSTLNDNSFRGGLIFDCYKEFRLARVKVYSSVPGERKIILMSSDDDLLAEKTVNIPLGTSVVELNMDIPTGIDMFLTTDAAFNQASIGTAGPQLRRSNQGCNYPYTIPDIVSIKTSNSDSERYYYFFNWEVDFYGNECESERVPVVATVLQSAVNTPVWASSLQVFPNPTSGLLNVSCKDYSGGKLMVSLKNVQGVTLQTKQVDSPAGSFGFSNDLSGLSKGVYWLELAGNEGVVRKKVIVQ